MGRITHKELVELYNWADFFINTSIVDNQPVTILEAFASGLVVISTNVGGIPNIISDGINGILIPSNNVEKMAEKIYFLLNNKNSFASLAKNGNLSIRNFGWENIYKKWLQVYNTLIL